jgi:hypothetical protein
MTTELKAGALPGLDDPQAQALKRAGANTVEKLAEADVEALARHAGLSADVVRRLKAQAAATAQGMERPRARRSPTVVYVILALVVITVIAVWYAVHVRAGAIALVAGQQGKLMVATARAASAAERHGDAAASNVGAGNWGLAQTNLDRVGDELTFIEQIAPRSSTRTVRAARVALGQAQEAVGRQDPAAAKRVDELKNALAELVGVGGG